METKHIAITLGVVLVAVMLGSGAIMLLAPDTRDFGPAQQNTVYLEKQCGPEYCPQNNLQIMPQDESDVIISKVFGTIYEDSDTASLLGTCSDAQNQPISSTALVTVYAPDTSKVVEEQTMQQIDTGRFNYSLTVPSTRGNYLVMLNCTASGEWAVAYSEFQNPDWTNKIQQALDDIAAITSSANTVKDFEIDKLTAVSPIYPNETIYLEATFSDENGTMIEPTAMNVTILYPNKTQFVSGIKTDFMNQDNIWNYSVLLTSSPTTGTYTVQLRANNSAKQAIKTTQFRIATGGPFSLRLECPSAVSAGTDLVCTVRIIDEGEVPVESTSTVWVDTDNDGDIDGTEPQTSFSKETQPQEIVVELASITIPSSHSGGVYVVRVKTEYLNSQQPDSTASDSVTIVPASTTTGGSGGGGGSNASCNYLVVQNNQCYTLVDGLCEQGCGSGQECIDLVCQQPAPGQEQLSLIDRLILFFKLMFDTESDLTARQIYIKSGLGGEKGAITSSERGGVCSTNIMTLVIIGLIVSVLMLIALRASVLMSPFRWILIGYWLFVLIYYYWCYIRGG